MADTDGTKPAPEADEQGRILSIHLGQSANCSSVGSVVDILFVSTVAASAVLAAIVILLEKKADETTPGKGTAARAKTPAPDRETDA